jgi:hypothetical protein
MEFIEMTADYFLNYGLELVSFKTSNKTTNVERFRTTYGIQSNTAKDVYDKLQLYEGDEKIINVDLFYFFVTLYWMHNYLKEALMLSMFKIKSPKTLRKYNWEYMEAIQALSITEVSVIMGNFIYISP